MDDKMYVKIFVMLGTAWEPVLDSVMGGLSTGSVR